MEPRPQSTHHCCGVYKRAVSIRLMDDILCSVYSRAVSIRLMDDILCSVHSRAASISGNTVLEVQFQTIQVTLVLLFICTIQTRS